MSRVSSWATKRNAISGFFARWPTPSAVLDAEPDSLLPVMKPLGLFENRSVAPLNQKAAVSAGRHRNVIIIRCDNALAVLRCSDCSDCSDGVGARRTLISRCALIALIRGDVYAYVLHSECG